MDSPCKKEFFTEEKYPSFFQPDSLPPVPTRLLIEPPPAQKSPLHAAVGGSLHQKTAQRLLSLVVLHIPVYLMLHIFHFLAPSVSVLTKAQFLRRSFRPYYEQLLQSLR